MTFFFKVLGKKKRVAVQGLRLTSDEGAEFDPWLTN